MDVTGRTVIYSHNFGDWTAYSRKISFKDADGEKQKIYEPIKFKGGDPGLQNGSYIEVIHGFESGFMNKDGEPMRRLVVMEWKMIGEPRESEGDFQALQEEIPF